MRRGSGGVVRSDQGRSRHSGRRSSRRYRGLQLDHGLLRRQTSLEVSEPVSRGVGEERVPGGVGADRLELTFAALLRGSRLGGRSGKCGGELGRG